MQGIHRVASRGKQLAFLSVLVLATILGYQRLTAHAIDFIGMSFSPSASMVGGSGNWTVTNPVAGGSSITFGVTLSIKTQGGTTTFPRTIGFGASTAVKPSGAADVVVSGLSSSQTFTAATGAGSSFTDSITLTAPATPGAYTVRFTAISGTGGQGGLSPGNGININFTVAETQPPCEPAATVLTVGDMCVLFKQTEPVDLTATLTAGGTGVSGQAIDFYVDGTLMGQAVTDANGVATLEDVDVSGLAVGDHEVVATYAGQDCEYLPTNGTGNLGVEYLFLGFQQPINADGSSAFGGRTIPVKIKIADANGQPVSDAVAHVYFAFGTPAIVGTDAEPLANTNGDSGNLMRYDSAADQYIFNWDIAGLANGTYTVRVDLGEGECGDQHSVMVSLKKKGGK
jgi:hypothetical protein